MMTQPDDRLFDLDGSPWERVSRANATVAELADRHYPRRSIGCGRVGGPSRTLVLRSIDGAAGWITSYTVHPDDGLDAWRCTMFRNEGPLLSSELIIAAVADTSALWGAPPSDGWLTYVDAAKVRSSNPGFCFLRAGWARDHTYRPDRRRASLVRLVLRPISLDSGDDA